MKRRMGALRARPGRWSTAVAAAALLMLGSALVGPAGATSATSYRQTNLVSDIPGVARVTDPNLVNPWGLAELPGGPLWVADNGADVATVYVGAQHGSPLTPAPLVVDLPGRCADRPGGLHRLAVRGHRRHQLRLGQVPVRLRER